MDKRIDSELTIQQIFEILLKRWYILLITPLLVAIIAGIYLNATNIPIYVSNATLYIVGERKDQSLTQTDLALGTMLINDYRELVKTKLVINEVIARLPNEKLSYNRIASSVSVTSLKDTRILNITVFGTEARLTALLANTVRDVFAVKVKEIMMVDAAQPLDEAVMPISPMPSNINRNIALAALVALMIAVGIILLLAMVDTTIKSEEDIARYLELNVLGKIPSYLGGKNDSDGTAKMPLSKAYSAMEGFVREAVKTLRTNILYSGIDKSINTVAITSTTPNEGKTSNSIFLAIAMAELGKRVCIVDCDLRRPMVCRQFGIQQRPGVTDIVTGRATLDDVMTSTHIPNLFIIDAGHKLPNPAEALNSQRFAKLTQDINSRFEFVVYDTPPLAAFIDAALVGRHVDGTLLLIDQGKVRRANATEAVEQLKRINVPILGVILNHLDTKGRGTGHYLKYYNYYNLDNRAKGSSRRNADLPKSNA